MRRAVRVLPVPVAALAGVQWTPLGAAAAEVPMAPVDEVIGGVLPDTHAGEPDVPRIMDGDRVSASGDEPAMAAEEWSAGIVHWTILALALGVCWFWMRGGGAGQLTGGAHASPQKPDAEELRRKRLEALQRCSSTSEQVPSASSRAAPVEGGGGGAATGAASPAAQRVAPDAAERVEAPTTGVGAADIATSSVPPAESEAPQPQADPVAVVPKADGPISPVEPALKQGQSQVAPRAAAGGSPPEELADKTNEPAEVLAPQFSVQLRGTLRGTTTTRSVGGLTPSVALGSLRDLAGSTFGVSADTRIRMFFNGKELKNLEAELGTLNIIAGSTIQVMFIMSGSAATGTVGQDPPASPSAGRKEDPVSVGGAAAAGAGSGECPPSIRVQGSLRGTAAVHVIDGLLASATVLELEDRITAAFGAGDDLRLRLFYMGRELKEPERQLGSVGFKAGATLQAMFAAGKLQSRLADSQAATAASAGNMAGSAGSAVSAEPAMATASESAAGADAPDSTITAALAPAIGLPGAQGSDGTSHEAVTAAAAAVGCGAVATSQGASPGLASAAASAAAEVSPEDAWRAMAGLEEQLARADDANEDPPLRQAAVVLKQMLMTATHGNNPALLQFTQAAVPDLSKIWNYEPTRAHLLGLLSPSVSGQGTGIGGGSSSAPMSGGPAGASSSTS
mmetsp:Transcript_110789/g.357587  ORF Transcript_110789/g.357587 Transcript_110789/m.357587 type:complete len:680 (+) Transcript_110789:87-2126(+)